MICELILALVSLWLLLNSIKKNPKEKRPIDFFALFYLKIFFDYYIIILPLFGFERGYGMTERLDFILTEINGYYKPMIGGNLLYFWIRRENDLSK